MMCFYHHIFDSNCIIFLTPNYSRKKLDQPVMRRQFVSFQFVFDCELKISSVIYRYLYFKIIYILSRIIFDVEHIIFISI